MIALASNPQKNTKTGKIVLPKTGQSQPRHFFRSDQKSHFAQLPPPQTALIVDDDKSVRKAIKYVLERRLQLRVFQASNGIEAISLVRQHNFDLIISDVNMPGMNGLEFRAWLEDNQIESLDKLIFITGGNDTATHLRAHSPGRTKVLDKPFSLQDFINHCAGILARVDSI
jgi:CheY-like chemotaxis protein